MGKDALASLVALPYELVPNISQYTLNNLQIHYFCKVTVL